MNFLKILVEQVVECVFMTSEKHVDFLLNKCVESNNEFFFANCHKHSNARNWHTYPNEMSL